MPHIPRYVALQIEADRGIGGLEDVELLVDDEKYGLLDCEWRGTRGEHTPLSSGP